MQECHHQRHTKKKIRMNSKSILISLVWFFIAHIAVWFQLNGQFKWDWFKNNEWVLALCGVPISFLYLWGTKYAVDGFDGLLWPGRFVGFGVGMVVFVSSIFNSTIKDFGEKHALIIMLSLFGARILANKNFKDGQKVYSSGDRAFAED